jgi:hypothetical protein
LFRKEIYLSFLLSISLFLIIDISSYNYNVLGQEDDNRDSHDNNVREDKDEEDDDDNNRDSHDNNVREDKDEEEEDFEDASLNELFDDNNDDDNNNVREDKDEEEEEDEKEEKDEVPFILPFKAVPFP